ncbi:MAG: hypothetical protein JSU01_14430 [Bacteroidetes bacterium]|nr:hypothetical protein [Bacteroidota bacterium]
MNKLFKPLTGIFHWLDRHIYHIGYDPKIHSSFPGDNHFGVTFYLTLILFGILVTVVWGVLDKKRSNYDRLFYWFCIYLRYVLAITIIGYGIDKIIPVQMSSPSAAVLTEPYGNLNRFNVLWTFMGVSPGYMIFTGSLEVIAGLLLFFRRTTLAGCLLVVAILSNIVALNCFYNVGVKLFSLQMLLFALFLLAPYYQRLFQFFFTDSTTAVRSPKRFFFQNKRKKYLVTAMLLFIPLATIGLELITDYKTYNVVAANGHRQKIYDVSAFVAKDTLAPLTTDTMRWKRVLLFVEGHNMVVYNMQDKGKWYKFKIDSSKNTLTLNSDDKAKMKVFHYTYPAKDLMNLTGKWNGKDISVSLKVSPLDSIPLNKERVTFFEEE